jgi:hypothetical protein
MRRFQPEILGGLFIGVFSVLPIVGLANLFCCLWVVVGGVLTVYLKRQGRAGVEVGEAILGGLVAGLVGAVIFVAASTLLFAASGGALDAQVQAALTQGDMPPEVRDRLMTLLQGRSLMLLMAAVTLPMFAVFSMLGAVVGFAIFRKPASAPPPPQS